MERIISSPALDTPIVVYGDPAPDLRGWAESVVCTFSGGVQICWTSESHPEGEQGCSGWGVRIEESWYGGTIDPPLPIPDAFRRYYEVDGSGRRLAGRG